MSNTTKPLMMKKNVYLTLFILSFSLQTEAQQVKVPIDTTVVTNHTTIIKGKTVPYKATTGFQPVWNEMREPVAPLFYSYYKRSDVKNDENRPLLISFNGDPGSASVWMHVVYTGSRILKIDSEGFPIQPSGIKSNPNSELDLADIVFINPANTFT